MKDGTRYVEAHHIIALGENGPDTLSNVIALCPNHHREAHFGEKAEALEQAFIEVLERKETRTFTAGRWASCPVWRVFPDPFLEPRQLLANPRTRHRHLHGSRSTSRVGDEVFPIACACKDDDVVRRRNP